MLLHLRKTTRIIRPSVGLRTLAIVAAALWRLAAGSDIAPASAQTASDSTVTLRWTAPGDDGMAGRANRYDLRYRSTAIVGTDTLSWWNAATPAAGLPTPGVAGTTDSFAVRSLAPATTYYFIVRAADEVPNWSGFSNVAVRVPTADTVPPAAIADLAVTGVTGSSIATRWTAPGDDGNTGTATSYDVRYSTSPITTSNWASATTVSGEPTPTAAGTQQTFTVSGLSGSSTYYIAIRTTDNSGNLSPLSNVVNATTTDTVPPAPVRDLSYGSELGPHPDVQVELAYRDEN